MVSKVDLIVKAYNSELIQDKNTPLKKGSFQTRGEKISFLTLKNEPLVLNFDSNNIDIVEFFNHSVIQIDNNNDLKKFKKKIYIFAKKSKNKEYWNAVADLIDKCI